MATKKKTSKVIAIINQKGGVGKSTTAVNLAAALGEEAKDCLVIDFDPQGNTTSGFGIEKDEIQTTIYDALFNEENIEQSTIQTKFKGVSIIPSTIQLAGAEVELVSWMARESVLADLIEPLKGSYDYIFIDCPPSLGLLTINALVAADSVLIPIQCEYYALEGVTKLLESMKMVQSRLNPKLSIFGVLLTMADTRTTLSKQVEEEVRAYFKKESFKTVIPRSIKLSEAPSHGQPITAYAKTSKGALAYKQLAKEVIKRG